MPTQRMLVVGRLQSFVVLSFRFDLEDCYDKLTIFGDTFSDTFCGHGRLDSPRSETSTRSTWSEPLCCEYRRETSGTRLQIA